jgi:[protein-PII] uridylyltransferase
MPSDKARIGPGTPKSGVPGPKLVTAASATNRSDAADDLVRARAVLLASQPGQRRQPPESLRTALVDLYDFWLTSRASALGIGDGTALLAVGALGRRELAPHSDLDLVFVHSGRPGQAVLAEQLWYPLWDAGIGLDHSVRTVGEAVQVAATDLRAAIGLIGARHLAGDQALSAKLVGSVRQAWRAGLRGRLEELIAETEVRWRRAGEVAHRVEPDLKNGRGGLRDANLIDALAIAQVVDRPSAEVPVARILLLDVRTELHRLAGRAWDVLRAQDAVEVAAALDLGDRFDLARAVSDAARNIAYAVDVAIRTARSALPRRGAGFGLRFGRGRMPVRRPLDEGVVEHLGEVALAKDAQPTRDPALVLRVAATAARTDLPIAAGTLAKLADTAPELREPWPPDALDELLALLGSGRRLVGVIEALDRTGLWGRLFPEWGAVRDLPPRDPAHTWTVDRHLAEVTAHASRLTTRVARPDLLLLGALLHDIGKGRCGDHSVVGAAVTEQIARRLGLWPDDRRSLVAIVRHHLLLPDTATRRDLDEPATIHRVLDTIDNDPIVLEVLHALAEADALATGPGVWSDWKAALTDKLVRRCRMLLAGDPLPAPEPIDASHPLAAAAAAGGSVQVLLDTSITPAEVTVIAPSRRGVLSCATGVLALNSLQVHSASVRGYGGSAIDVFAVTPRFGSLPDPALLREQLIRALEGSLPLSERLAAKERDYPVKVDADSPPPHVLWFDDEATGAVVVELRATDRIGLLHRVSVALEECGVDIMWAKVATLGTSAVDSFCLATPSGTIDAPTRRNIEQAIRTAAHP